MRKGGVLLLALAGAAAGAVAGLFGAGGGLVLVPLLGLCSSLTEESIFPASVSIILPICVVTLISTALLGGIPWSDSLPYLLGSAAGGWMAGTLGRKIPVVWLHRVLGSLILWGGIRYLC